MLIRSFKSNNTIPVQYCKKLTHFKKCHVFGFQYDKSIYQYRKYRIYRGISRFNFYRDSCTVYSGYCSINNFNRIRFNCHFSQGTPGGKGMEGGGKIGCGFGNNTGVTIFCTVVGGITRGVLIAAVYRR
jgi:hypothetical protein